MRRQEEHHFTREQLEGHLDDAIAILDARELEPSERAAVLPTLLQLLSNKQITFIQAPPIAAPAMAIPGTRRH